VSWYNGHPAFADLPVDLRGIEDVSVVGQGNVALDVARILLKGANGLEGTDMPESVLEVLSKSAVRRVRSVGRRGPGQVAFTTKEFREMVSLPDTAFAGVNGTLMDEGKAAVEGDRMRKRLLALMEKPNGVAGPKSFELDFLHSPKAFIPNETGKVSAVDWDLNALLHAPHASPAPPTSQEGSVPSPSPKASAAAMVARPTGETVRIPTDMVVESVGYRSEPLDGEGWVLPFDSRRGRVSNIGGRVVDDSGMAVSDVHMLCCKALGNALTRVTDTRSLCCGLGSEGSRRRHRLDDARCVQSRRGDLGGPLRHAASSRFDIPPRLDESRAGCPRGGATRVERAPGGRLGVVEEDRCGGGGTRKGQGEREGEVHQGGGHAGCHLNHDQLDHES
jgi:hypothetical protein